MLVGNFNSQTDRCQYKETDKRDVVEDCEINSL